MFEDSYSRYQGEGLSLSFPLNQGRDEAFPSQQSLGSHSSLLSISTDDWRQTMVMDAWRLRRMNDAPIFVWWSLEAFRGLIILFIVKILVLIFIQLAITVS